MPPKEKHQKTIFNSLELDSLEMMMDNDTLVGAKVDFFRFVLSADLHNFT